MLKNQNVSKLLVILIKNTICCTITFSCEINMLLFIQKFRAYIPSKKILLRYLRYEKNVCIHATAPLRLLFFNPLLDIREYYSRNGAN